MLTGAQLSSRIKSLVDGIAIQLTVEQLSADHNATGRTAKQVTSRSNSKEGTVIVPSHFLTLVEDREDGGRGRGKSGTDQGGVLRVAILKWIKAKNIQPDDPKTSLKSLAFVIARSLHKKGNLIFRGEAEGIRIQPIFADYLDQFQKGIEDDVVNHIISSLKKLERK
jgi:hypothetical protein